MVLLVATRSNPYFKRIPALALVWAGLLTICGAAWNLFRLGGRSSRDESLMLIAVALLLGIAAMMLVEREHVAEVRATQGSRDHWLILTALLVLHSFVAYCIVSSGPPRIDCFTIQQDVAKTLLQGRDPYGTTRANIYNETETRLYYGPSLAVNGRVQVGFMYPPATLLSTLPGYLVGDVRYGYVAAILLSAIFVFLLFPDTRGLSLAAVLLLAPTTYLVEYQSWTEPLVWMLLCATLYAAIRRPRWLPLAFGLFLASKQYSVFALPFFGYLIRPFSWNYWKSIGTSVVIAMATLLPFALWNFRALWHDLVLFHLAEPVRQDALSFAIPFPLYRKIGPLLWLAFMVWGARRRTQPPAVFAAAYGITLLLFFSASKLAAFNYFFLIAQAFLLTAAALWPGAQHPYQNAKIPRPLRVILSGAKRSRKTPTALAAFTGSRGNRCFCHRGPSRCSERYHSGNREDALHNCPSVRRTTLEKPLQGAFYTIKLIGLNGGVDETRTRGLRRDRRDVDVISTTYSELRDCHSAPCS